MDNPYQYLEEYVGKETPYQEFCELTKVEPLLKMQKTRQMKTFSLYMKLVWKNNKVKIIEIYSEDKIKPKVKSYHDDTTTKFNINPLDKNKSGIYKIQLNDTIYIGQTNNFIKRYYQHNAKLNRMNKVTKPLLEQGGVMEVIEFEDDLENRLLKESKYTIEYKLSGFNVLNDLTRIVKKDYSKENKKRLITIKVRLEDANNALKLLNDNDIFAERTSKKKCL
jgi:hypothetical protein